MVSFRTVSASLSLVITVARLLTHPLQEPSRADSWFFAVIVGAYISTVVSGLRLRRGTAGKGDAAGQVLSDVVIATGLVYLSGGADSPLTFLYSLAVMGAAAVLDRRGALWAAAGSMLAFTVMLVGGRIAVAEGGTVVTGRLLFVLGGNALALGLIAVLSGYLSRQLFAAGGALSQSEADLRRLGRLQQQILSSMPSGLVTCSAQRRITFVNAAGSLILHVEPAACVGQPLEKLMPGAAALAPRASRGELSVETPGGRRTLGLSVTPLDGEPGALLIVFQDLTELRRMEEDLRRADRLASLGALSAQLAHELRNPLAAMRGSAQLLSQEYARDAMVQKLTGILVREADRLARLVEDFLRFARPPEPQRRQVALEALLVETVDMLRADPLAREVKVEVSAPDRLTAPVDPDQLRQVLINLVRNGVQAAGPRGAVRVALSQAEREAQIRVWDSAGSITEEMMGHLFEPFFTTRDGGTGLGLSTAHSIVRAHGGSIRVRSHPAEGTEFIVGLPL
ncbi:PAS domain-containing sensor histidine kinase [Corallococcus sp. H22C18031201]|uniref:two-component system sensor histidine kinase NtrB n=1 Tax=Citreicoccus inhibens TaxID=2849499 RepID=UPI000E76DC6D|nr:ATP-binding protein [Citreicoccus inhibens]MBU8895993.1 PAS domain-containing protein [Citreicoccus inhibens]RJS26206.1 PAS domain-containing sensor histidine kinase [Corallococcus sp. H22C18031201]